MAVRKKYIATTFFGLENVLEGELRQLGAQNIEIGNRMVAFEGEDESLVYECNLMLRTAIRVLAPYKEFTFLNQKDYYNEIVALPWEELFDIDQTFSIDFVVNSPEFSYTKYAALLAKDAVVDRFKNETGDRPSVDRKDADFKIHVYVKDNLCRISLDSSGQPLYKRGYRQEDVSAPLNEILASGIVQMSDWNKKGTFLDPMCGSGTLAIEAALWAMNIPSQFLRDDFNFKNWKDFDQELWEKVKANRMAAIKEIHYPILARDKDIRAVNATLENVKTALLDEVISVEKEDFFESTRPEGPTTMVMNPPYNERIKIQIDFYESIGNTLKQQYPNTSAWVFTSDNDNIHSIRLRPSFKKNMYNGKLPCKLLNYLLFEGAYRSDK